MLKNQGGFVQPNAATVCYNPDEVAKGYKSPREVNVAGECIALIELGGGYRAADMENYFQKPGISMPVISAQWVDGGHNAPATPVRADGEVALDIQVAGAVAPGRKIGCLFHALYRQMFSGCH